MRLKPARLVTHARDRPKLGHSVMYGAPGTIRNDQSKNLRSRKPPTQWLHHASSPSEPPREYTNQPIEREGKSELWRMNLDSAKVSDGSGKCREYIR